MESARKRDHFLRQSVCPYNLNRTVINVCHQFYDDRMLSTLETSDFFVLFVYYGYRVCVCVVVEKQQVGENWTSLRNLTTRFSSQRGRRN